VIAAIKLTAETALIVVRMTRTSKNGEDESSFDNHKCRDQNRRSLSKLQTRLEDKIKLAEVG
jgi:hypothetical protein